MPLPTSDHLIFIDALADDFQVLKTALKDALRVLDNPDSYKVSEAQTIRDTYLAAVFQFGDRLMGSGSAGVPALSYAPAPGVTSNLAILSNSKHPFPAIPLFTPVGQ